VGTPLQVGPGGPQKRAGRARPVWVRSLNEWIVDGLFAGEGGVRQVPGRVLSARLRSSRPLLLRVARRHAGGACLVGGPLRHVPAHREQVLRDVHHTHDLRQQPVAGRTPQHTHVPVAFAGDIFWFTAK